MTKASPAKYEPCDRCAQSRSSGDYARAIACRLCKGLGFVPALGEDVCNGCGGSMASGTRADDRQIAAGIHKHELWGGYDSPGLTDTMKYTFSVCEHCLRRWFAGCKVPPKVERYDLVGIRPDVEESYAEDHERYEYQQWRDNLGFSNAHLHGICNQTRTCQKPAKWSLVLSESVTDHCLCDEHKNEWDTCTNAAIVPFVPNGFWTRFSEVKETVPDAAAPAPSNDAYRIKGNLPEPVVSGLMAAIWDTTYTRVQADLRYGPKEPETFLRVEITAAGATGDAVPNLQIKIDATSRGGFRRRAPHLQMWLHGALLAALDKNQILDVVLAPGWKQPSDENAEE